MEVLLPQWKDRYSIDLMEAVLGVGNDASLAELCGADGSSRQQEEPAMECSIHLDRIQNGEHAHRGLTQGCAANHNKEDEIICTSCLKQHLYGQMFPLDNEKIRHRFPSPIVKCWASDCSEVLDHHIIQNYADADAFRLYDIALCQRYLGEDSSMVKCIFPDCTGAEWADKTSSTDSKIFCCPVCSRSTCRECNGPYELHLNRPCPAAEKPRNPTKIKLEETASKIKLSMKHKCPKCPLRYKKMSGCDQIVCGGSFYDSISYGGCAYRFCHRCKGPWTRKGHRFYCMYNYLRCWL